MRKQLYGLTVVLPAALFILWGCRKEWQSRDMADTGLTVLSAKSWYASHRMKPVNEINQLVPAFEPIWEKAIASSDKQYEVVDCPLDFKKQPAFNLISGGKSGTGINGAIRLLVLKNRETGEIKAALMNVHDRSGEIPAKITYRNRGDHFSGIVFFTNLAGELVNGWKYENGIITKASKKAASETIKTLSLQSIKPNRAPGAGEEEGCETVEFQHYHRDCYTYENGDRWCTEWVYTGSSYQWYCSNSSGGTGLYQEEEHGTDSEDPCAKAKPLSDSATKISKDNSFITAKNTIQSAAANDNKEHSVTFGRDANGNITTSPVITGGTNSASTNSNWPGAFADFHNHPNNVPPSAGDLYGLIKRNSNNSNHKTRYVITPNGSTYAFIVVNLGLAKSFTDKYPSEDIGFGPDFPSAILDEFFNVQNAAVSQGADNMPAIEMAMAFILDKYNMGMALLKQESNGSFKKLQTTETTSADGKKVYTANNCPQ